VGYTLSPWAAVASVARPSWHLRRVLSCTSWPRSVLGPGAETSRIKGAWPAPTGSGCPSKRTWAGRLRQRVRRRYVAAL
jgi:hypothetical protein